eukprot:scaffold29070_cov66-Phaeocystis_antarctica.AAC.2
MVRRGKCYPRTARARVPESLPSAIFEFDSPSNPIAGHPTVRISRGRQHGEQDQEASARPALGACATRPGHAPLRAISMSTIASLASCLLKERHMHLRDK